MTIVEGIHICKTWHGKYSYLHIDPRVYPCKWIEFNNYEECLDTAKAHEEFVKGLK